MRELSPAAQAVMDAFVSNAGEGHRHQSAAVAAALRAAAIEIHNPWGGRIESAGSMWMRDQILAIAAELESVNG